MPTLIVECHNYSNTLNRVNKLFLGDFGRQSRRVRSCLSRPVEKALRTACCQATLPDCLVVAGVSQPAAAGADTTFGVFQQDPRRGMIPLWIW